MHYLTKDLMIQYETNLKIEERSKATIEKYRRDLIAFFQFLPTGKTVTKNAVIQYKEYLTERYKVSSVNSMLAAVNGFLSYMGWLEYKVKPLKVQKKIFCSKEKELTKEEYLRLIAVAKRNSNQRLSLVMETICATGIRVSELRFITTKAIECGHAEVFCKGKNRTIFLPQKLCNKLKHYMQQTGIRTGIIFVTKSGNPLNRSNIWHDMKCLCEQAGVASSKVFPHNLRHLFARTYYGIEKDLNRLADILGHSNIETTRIYTITTGIEHEKQIASLGLVV